jgi:phenylalanyl-tRNA synthetase beta chain
MKLSRDWLTDFVDLSGIPAADLDARFPEIGHAIESVEEHDGDTVYDLEITTNRIDAMSHFGMARELGAAFGRNVAPPPAAPASGSSSTKVDIRIDAPEMCRRYTAQVIRGVTIKPSPHHIAKRLEAVGLRPINNVVDATNYAMLALGHPLHAFDLDKLSGPAIIVRAGQSGESMKTLDGETRKIDPETAVIADATHAVALGGVMGGFESEITDGTTNVLLECAWFTPSVIRRTARRLGLKTDASYRFERGVDPNDTLTAIAMTADLIVKMAGGVAEAPIDVVAAPAEAVQLTLREKRLAEASAGVIGLGYAVELFQRLGFQPHVAQGGVGVTVPTFRGDIREEMDLIEEVLRFYGLNKVPATLPRLTTGDSAREPAEVALDQVRDVLVGSGLTEVVNYSFIHPQHNAVFATEAPVAITNALTENVSSMRLSLLPGLLETVTYNRSYGTRDGALFEVGRSYHRDGDAVREQSRAAFVMFGDYGDFFDAKGAIELVAARFHAPLTYARSQEPYLQEGKQATAFLGDRRVAVLGALRRDVLQMFGVKGDAVAAEIMLEPLLAARPDWKMAPVARFPGIPMILAVTHTPQLEYQKLVETIRSFEVPHLHEVGLRDRFVPEGSSVVKTTLGMWYQAFDRSLTQDEVTALQQQLASRLSAALPVQIIT